jgi:hypothetical protein
MAKAPAAEAMVRAAAVRIVLKVIASLLLAYLAESSTTLPYFQNSNPMEAQMLGSAA